MRTYTIHGLTLVSEYELDAVVLDPADGPAAPDYELRAGPPRPCVGRPDEPGEIIAELELGATAEWLLEREDGSWLLRYERTADFEIDRRAGRIVAHPAPGIPDGLVPILAGGGVLAHLISGRDRLVLHASAVEIGGRAVGIVGSSGAGKSVTATHLCLAGAPLLTDDTLVVHFSDDRNAGPPRVHPGSRSIRLHPVACSRFEGIEPLLEPQLTADDRLLVRPKTVEEPELELAMVVAIEFAEGAKAIETSRLTGTDATLTLLANPRATAWCDPDRLRAQFSLAARLATEIPVLQWTLPDRPASEPLGPELLRILRSQVASSSQ
ncbi:MAG TPA: hypothetical protein VM285_02455 [Polyangia bacterium]|nr:hypothetical protein [Polyangia bacterium]